MIERSHWQVKTIFGIHGVNKYAYVHLLSNPTASTRQASYKDRMKWKKQEGIRALYLMHGGKRAGFDRDLGRASYVMIRDSSDDVYIKHTC